MAVNDRTLRCEHGGTECDGREALLAPSCFKDHLRSRALRVSVAAPLSQGSQRLHRRFVRSLPGGSAPRTARRRRGPALTVKPRRGIFVTIWLPLTGASTGPSAPWRTGR